MAFVVNILTVGGTSTDQSSYTTASATPTANALVFAVVHNNHTAPVTTPTSCTGSSIPWTQHQTLSYSTIASGTCRLTIYRGVAASPTTGTLVFDFGGALPAHSNWGGAS